MGRALSVQVYINQFNQVTLGQTTAGASGLGAQPAGATSIVPATGRKLFSKLFSSA